MTDQNIIGEVESWEAAIGRSFLNGQADFLFTISAFADWLDEWGDKDGAIHAEAARLFVSLAEQNETKWKYTKAGKLRQRMPFRDGPDLEAVVWNVLHRLEDRSPSPHWNPWWRMPPDRVVNVFSWGRCWNTILFAVNAATTKAMR